MVSFAPNIPCVVSHTAQGCYANLNWFKTKKFFSFQFRRIGIEIIFRLDTDQSWKDDNGTMACVLWYSWFRQNGTYELCCRKTKRIKWMSRWNLQIFHHIGLKQNKLWQKRISINRLFASRPPRNIWSKAHCHKITNLTFNKTAIVSSETFCSRLEDNTFSVYQTQSQAIDTIYVPYVK